jgi:hypothetical protein
VVKFRYDDSNDEFGREKPARTISKPVVQPKDLPQPWSPRETLHGIIPPLQCGAALTNVSSKQYNVPRCISDRTAVETISKQPEMESKKHSLDTKRREEVLNTSVQNSSGAHDDWDAYGREKQDFNRAGVKYLVADSDFNIPGARDFSMASLTTASNSILADADDSQFLRSGSLLFTIHRY